ncbi:hypothetical protein TYRP_020225 [Tyrophagus putrescentiae]|nr:hypothetical protein TYRP_020225 [Tyrophagus putrescentiae]
MANSVSRPLEISFEKSRFDTRTGAKRSSYRLATSFTFRRFFTTALYNRIALERSSQGRRPLTSRSTWGIGFGNRNRKWRSTPKWSAADDRGPGLSARPVGHRPPEEDKRMEYSLMNDDSGGGSDGENGSNVPKPSQAKNIVLWYERSKAQSET